MARASNTTKVTVLGAGSWGTALALLLAEGGRTVTLWDRNPAHIAALRADRENRRYLPGFPLPSSLFPNDAIAESITGATCLVVAVPSSAVRDVIMLASPHLSPHADIVLAAKGMEEATGLFPAEVAAEVRGAGSRERGTEETELPDSPSTAPSLIVLSGPNLAAEVARGVPTAAVAACPDNEAAERTAERFNRAAFRVYTTEDRLGVEIGGAIKNVLAIAGGVSDGLGFGDNTKAALLTRGLVEMTRLGTALGADARTFYGLAGVGDLMATAASRLSRNWRVGEGLAKGETLDAILARLGQVAEGVPTARAVGRLAEKMGVEMPVCRTVAAMLFEGMTPRAAVESLLARSRKGEWDGGGLS
jgi:glycerol-3-phosphate dehydrogenase (NAD(P)+)